MTTVRLPANSLRRVAAGCERHGRRSASRLRILVGWRDQAAAEQPAASRFVPCTHRSCAKPHLQRHVCRAGWRRFSCTTCNRQRRRLYGKWMRECHRITASSTSSPVCLHRVDHDRIAQSSTRTPQTCRFIEPAACPLSLSRSMHHEQPSSFSRTNGEWKHDLQIHNKFQF